eukprot:COSAG06_NODE_911_length_11587_cov_2.115164_6_plen_350_part_00
MAPRRVAWLSRWRGGRAARDHQLDNIVSFKALLWAKRTSLGFRAGERKEAQAERRTPGSAAPPGGGGRPRQGNHVAADRHELSSTGHSRLLRRVHRACSGRKNAGNRLSKIIDHANAIGGVDARRRDSETADRGNACGCPAGALRRWMAVGDRSIDGQNRHRPTVPQLGSPRTPTKGSRRNRRVAPPSYQSTLTALSAETAEQREEAFRRELGEIGLEEYHAGLVDQFGVRTVQDLWDCSADELDQVAAVRSPGGSAMKSVDRMRLTQAWAERRVVAAALLLKPPMPAVRERLRPSTEEAADHDTEAARQLAAAFLRKAKKASAGATAAGTAETLSEAWRNPSQAETDA